MGVKNIMIVGVGGQGTLLTSRILGNLAIHAGYDVKLSEVHGMAQRGGSVVTFVRYGEQVAEPIVEEGCADVLIAFERLEALRYLHFLKKGGVVIVNDWRIDPITVVTGAAVYPEGILETLQSARKTIAVEATSESEGDGCAKGIQCDCLRRCGPVCGVRERRLAAGDRGDRAAQDRGGEPESL